MDIVRLLDDAPAEQPVPDAVDHVAGEPRVLRLDQPVGENGARVQPRREMRALAVGENRRGGRLFGGIEVDDLLFPLVGGLVTDLRKERRHFADPLSAARSHKGEGHGLRQRRRLLALGGAVEIDLGNAEIAAVRHQQLARDLVVGHVVSDGGVNPLVVRLHRVGPQVDGELRLDAQQFAPAHGLVIGKLVPFEQAVDEGAAFGGVRVGQELRRLFGGGEGADDVEVGAPQEDLIGAGPGGLDGELFPVVEDDLVDPAMRREGCGAFEGSDGRAVRRGGGQARRQHQEAKWI